MITPLSDAAKAARRELREVYERAYAIFLDKLEVAPTPNAIRKIDSIYLVPCDGAE